MSKRHSIPENIFLVLPTRKNGEDKKQENLSKEPGCSIQGASTLLRVVESNNIVGDLMWPIIFFLRVCGHSPLSYERAIEAESLPGKVQRTTSQFKERTSRQYRIRFKSFFFVWSIFCATWVLFSWITSIYGMWAYGIQIQHKHSHDDIRASSREQITIQNTKELQSNSLVLAIMTAMGIILSIVQVSEVILAWAETRSSARFFNDWAPIQKQFEITFPFVSVMGDQYRIVKRTRNFLLVAYVAVPTLLFLPGILATPFMAKDVRLIIYFTIIPYAFHISAVSLMEDVKVLVTYRILAAAFCQVHEGILYALKWEEITSEKIKSWRRLIHSVRLQVVRAGESQKGHQLLLIGGCVFLITSSVFVLLKGDKDSWITIFAGLGFLFLQTGRLYLKILAANSITYEEGLIVNELLLMDISGQSTIFQLEVKCLYDMMNDKPSCISFGNYVNLNKKLLLGVTSQVVTYLIVLLQFTS